MTLNLNTQGCEEFQAQMAELIGSGQDVSTHPHVQTCARCHALLVELETIAEVARQLFPVEDPPDTVWEKLESAIKMEGSPSRGC